MVREGGCAEETGRGDTSRAVSPVASSAKRTPRVALSVAGRSNICGRRRSASTGRPWSSTTRTRVAAVAGEAGTSTCSFTKGGCSRAVAAGGEATPARVATDPLAECGGGGSVDAGSSRERSAWRRDGCAVRESSAGCTGPEGCSSACCSVRCSARGTCANARRTSLALWSGEFGRESSTSQSRGRGIGGGSPWAPCSAQCCSASDAYATRKRLCAPRSIAGQGQF